MKDYARLFVVRTAVVVPILLYVCCALCPTWAGCPGCVRKQDEQTMRKPVSSIPSGSVPASQVPGLTSLHNGLRP